MRDPTWVSARSGLTIWLAAASLISSFFAFSLGAHAQSWDAILERARKEGAVFVHGGPGEAQREALTEGFRKAYPEIKVSFTGSAGRDAIPVITRERAGGIFKWDVYVGGTPSILRTLKPDGAFAPLRPALMRPDVIDDANWFGGLDAGWMDLERKTTLAFALTINPIVFVNWDYIDKSALQTFDDLLKPEFAGKIVWDDPRLPGQGGVTALGVMLHKGPDFLSKLLSTQQIVFTRNSRQHVEWLSRGRYPIGIGSPWDQIEFFRRQGLAKNVSRGLVGAFEKQVGGPGFGTVSLMDKGPNPNAAIVYVNWLLSREAQIDWSTKTASNSRRLDVKPAAADLAPSPSLPLIIDQSEGQIRSFEEALEISKSSIPNTPEK